MRPVLALWRLIRSRTGGLRSFCFRFAALRVSEPPTKKQPHRGFALRAFLVGPPKNAATCLVSSQTPFEVVQYRTHTKPSP